VNKDFRILVTALARVVLA